MENYKINVEATIDSILARVRGSKFNSVNEPKLREKVDKEPGFLLEAAQFVGAEVVYM